MADATNEQTQTPEPGVGRRRVLACMAWAGSGVVWSLNGGVAASAVAGSAGAADLARGAFSFVQISDSHIGFTKAANPDPLATLRATIAQIRALPARPSFVLHTGDITHLATAEQFDTAQAAFAEIGVSMHVTPGEHDIADGTDPRPYLDRFGKGTKGDGWYSFDAGGAHFVGLVNVLRLGDRGQGTLGEAQIAWLKDDLAGRSASAPIVVFSHFPLWALYPDWGWGTEDSDPAMALLARFGSVTVLNGHIHQVQQKVEGHLCFHTARSTAYPQPAPGEGAGPGPLALPAEQLRTAIGLTSVSRKAGRGPLAVIDATLA